MGENHVIDFSITVVHGRMKPVRGVVVWSPFWPIRGLVFLLVFWAGMVLWRDRTVLLLGGWFEGAFYFCNFFLGVTFFVLLGFSRKFLSWWEELIVLCC